MGQFPKSPVSSLISQLGDKIIWVENTASGENVCLSFLGVLLSKDGPECEKLLVRYLEYLINRYESDANENFHKITFNELKQDLTKSEIEAKAIFSLIYRGGFFGSPIQMVMNSNGYVGIPEFTAMEKLRNAKDLFQVVREQAMKDLLETYEQDPFITGMRISIWSSGWRLLLKYP